MLLDLQDIRVRTTIIQKSRNQIRLTLEYPNTPDFRRKVQNALAGFLHSNSDFCPLLGNEVTPHTPTDKEATDA